MPNTDQPAVLFYGEGRGGCSLHSPVEEETGGWSGIHNGGTGKKFMGGGTQQIPIIFVGIRILQFTLFFIDRANMH